MSKLHKIVKSSGKHLMIIDLEFQIEAYLDDTLSKLSAAAFDEGFSTEEITKIALKSAMHQLMDYVGVEQASSCIKEIEAVVMAQRRELGIL